jgi:hypothetical protein
MSALPDTYKGWKAFFDNLDSFCANHRIRTCGPLASTSLGKPLLKGISSVAFVRIVPQSVVHKTHGKKIIKYSVEDILYLDSEGEPGHLGYAAETFAPEGVPYLSMLFIPEFDNTISSESARSLKRYITDNGFFLYEKHKHADIDELLFINGNLLESGLIELSRFNGISNDTYCCVTLTTYSKVPYAANRNGTYSYNLLTRDNTAIDIAKNIKAGVKDKSLADSIVMSVFMI